MDCNSNKPKRSYHFNVTEVADGKIKDVMSFNLCGHHDLAAMAEMVKTNGQFSDKHAKELIVGIRLLHHVMKKYPDNELFKGLCPAFDAFKKRLKECTCKDHACDDRTCKDNACDSHTCSE